MLRMGLKILRRVISVLKPVKAPLTTIYKWSREAWASIARNATILVSPATFRGSPLVGTAIEDSNTTTGHLDMKNLSS